MQCPYCKKEAEWVNNKEVYGKSYGSSVMMYWCRLCDARVGCHRNSRRALGTMANAELRLWRTRAHAIFDPVWKSGRYQRHSAYFLLAQSFGREIHIGEADIALCKEIIKAVPFIFDRKV